jgi:hypothetical protein
LEDEMKIKQNKSKWVRITLGVAFTFVFITVGLVLADRGASSPGAGNASALRFQEYLEAIARTEQEQAVSLAPSPSTDSASALRFQEYLEAIARTEQEQSASLVSSPSTDSASANRFQDYLDAIERAEREQAEAYANR